MAFGAKSYRLLLMIFFCFESLLSKKLEKRSKVISTLIFGLLVNFCIFMTLHCFFSVLILQEGKNIISTFETMYGSALDLLDDGVCRAVKVLIVEWPLCNI